MTLGGGVRVSHLPDRGRSPAGLTGHGRWPFDFTAYTWQVFASQPYGEIIGAYPVPHNHILDSLLVRLSTQVLVAK